MTQTDAKYCIAAGSIMTESVYLASSEKQFIFYSARSQLGMIRGAQDETAALSEDVARKRTLLKVAFGCECRQYLNTRDARGAGKSSRKSKNGFLSACV